MPVSLFTDGLEPTNADATLWRFMEFWKFRNLIETGTLYFCRADKFADDETEGLPPEEVGRLLVAPLEEMVVEDVGQWYGINRLFRQARRLESP